MDLRLTPQRLIGLGFGLALALQVVTAGLAYRNAHQQVADTREIQATNRVLASLTALLSDLRSAESHQRAFIVTGDAQYRHEYDRAVAHVEEALAAAKEATAENAGQAARLAATEPMIRERLLNLRFGLDTFQRSGSAKALEIVREDAAVALTTQVRAALHGMALTETARLERRSSQAEATAKQTMFFVALAGGLALLFALGASWIVRRDQGIRLAVEASLRTTTNQLQTLIAHLHVGILVVDADGTIFLVNGDMLTLFDVTGEPADYIGQSAAGLRALMAVKFADQDWAHRRARELAAAGKVVQGEEVLLVDGRTLERDYVPIRLDGERYGNLWICRDVTGRKEAEVILTKALKREQAATQAKSEFLANMSHELRTPLNSVIGFAEMLDDEVGGPLEPDQRDFVQTIQRNGKHLLNLINEILDLSKIEAGRLSIYPEPLDLAAMVGDVVGAMRPLAEKKRIPISLEGETETAMVEADPLRLKQVLTNLLTNAVKFSPEERPIRVSIARHGDEVHLAVIDRGIGIAPEDLGRIFQEFVQVESSYNKRQEGTGLGLSLAKRLIEMQGGRLWVESRLGEGTTFTFALPVRRSSVTPADGMPVAGSPVVLLVDDDPDALTLMSATLSPMGVTLVTATDGITALERARDMHPTMIVLDMHLPRQDGWTVLSALRADPGLATIPVIVVSIDDNEALGLRLGASEYLVKPLDRTKLRQLVGHYLIRPAHVLVVEDNADFRHYLVQVLRPWGGDVRTAANGAEALQAIAERRPELVLLDINMPVMDGWEFLEQMPADLPVVVITGQPLTADQQERLSQHVLAVWEKGALDPTTLSGNIQSLLDVAEPTAAPEAGA